MVAKPYFFWQIKFCVCKEVAGTEILHQGLEKEYGGFTAHQLEDDINSWDLKEEADVILSAAEAVQEQKQKLNMLILL